MRCRTHHLGGVGWADDRDDPADGTEPDGVHAGVSHHPRVARRRAAGNDVDRELPRPAARRCGRAEAGTAVVEGSGCDVRRRRGDRHGAVVRVRAALAGVHRALRAGLRPAVRDRRHLLLPGGDLHRDLHLRLEAPLAVDAFLVRCAGRDHGARRSVLGRRGQLVDEPASGVFTYDREGDVGRAVEGDLQPGRAVRGAAHDPGRVSRHRLSRRLDLRGRDAPWPPRPHPSSRPPDPADGRLHRDPDPVRGRRHRGARNREGPADQVRRHGVRRRRRRRM